MNYWMGKPRAKVDAELLEEAALAMAQSTIQNAIDRAGISRAELARKMNRPRSFVSLMLSGRHNLTVRTMSRALTACGFGLRFQHVPLVWQWRSEPPRPLEAKVENVPAQAGTSMPATLALAGLAVPTCALGLGV